MKAVAQKVGKKNTKQTKQTKQKRALRTTTNRKFTKKANDPRFSTISADVDRDYQTRRMPTTKLAELSNGLRVASEQQIGGLTTVCVSVDAGSRYETAENNGTAHFLEHTLFKGTNKRSRTQLEMEIENMGGHLNAFTSREQTVFTATVQNRHWKQAMELMADIFQNSKITDKIVEDERGVIIQEMESVANDMQETVYDRMHESAFRNQSLSYNILGPLDNIKKISKKDIDTYISTHYTAPRTVVSVVGGDLDHEEVVDQTTKNFGGMVSEPKNGIKPNKGVANFIGSDIRVRDDDMPKLNFAIGFETAGWNDPIHYPLMAFQMMLGSHHYSRAHTDAYSSSEVVRQQGGVLGHAESFQPFNTIYSDTGIFGFYAVCSPMHADALAPKLIRALHSPILGVPEQTLIEAKAKLKLSLLSQYEGTENTAQEIGRQLLSHNRRIHPSEIVARVDDVTEANIQHVVNKLFVDQDFVVSALGNTFELPVYPQLRKATYRPWM